MSKKEKVALPGHNSVEEFMVYFWMLFIFASVIFCAIVWQVYKNFPIITIFFDSLNFSNPLILNFLKWNAVVIWGIFVAYLMTIAVWKVKKGIFSESERMVRVWSGVFVYRIFTMAVLVPFLIYLVNTTLPGSDSLRQLWIFLLFVSQLLLMYPFVAEKPQQDRALKSKYFMIVWIVVFLTFIGVSLFIKPFWELTIIIFISSIVLPSSEMMLKRYMQSIESYDAIKAVNEMNDEFLDKVRKWEPQYPFRGESLSGNPASLPYAFQSLDNLGYILVAGAFGSLMTSWIYHANIITAVYIHTTLILCALQLWITSNRFPPRVNIRTGTWWIEGVFLLERSKDKILVMDEKWKILFRPEEVSEIRIPLRVKNTKVAPKTK